MDKVTVLFPGGFRPLHGGHIELLHRYEANNKVNKIKLLIGPAIRGDIAKNAAINIANILLKNFSKTEITDIDNSPVFFAYTFMETAKPGKYALAASNKNSDYERVKSFTKEHYKNGRYHDRLAPGVKVVRLIVDIEPLYYYGRNDEFEGQPISASTLRKDVENCDFINFKTNYPQYAYDIISEIWFILKNKIIW
jgi:hypothetical protein